MQCNVCSSATPNDVNAGVKRTLESIFSENGAAPWSFEQYHSSRIWRGDSNWQPAVSFLMSLGSGVMVQVMNDCV